MRAADPELCLDQVLSLDVGQGPDVEVPDARERCTCVHVDAGAQYPPTPSFPDRSSPLALPYFDPPQPE